MGANVSKRLGRSSGGVGGGWDAGLQPLCAHAVRAREIGEERNSMPLGMQYRCGWEKSRKLILKQRNK